jgi:hypothetical protein
MNNTIINQYIESAKSEFRRYKSRGQSSINLLSENELNENINDANSIAIIVKHLYGNMRSRWTNIFTEDGEKSDRNRDEEFSHGFMSKDTILTTYANAWTYLEDTLNSLTNDDFDKPVIIRNESLTLVQAINRQISHYAYHIGQIVIMSKQFKGENWISLSIPKGKSLDFKNGNYTKH